MQRSLFPVVAALLACGAFSTPGFAEEARVIVKYKASAAEHVHAVNRGKRLAARMGMMLSTGRRIHDHAEVIRTHGMSSEALAARLAREPEVEYAVPDRLRRIRALPNDPIFAHQWYLQATEAAAIRATEAWDRTTGSAAVVVAVVDTGVRFEHPDLSARLLPGYNFISDPANSGDGGGRDDDASDPGDFVSNTDLFDPNLVALCGGGLHPQFSSWHGTRVAGVIGAAGNNAEGIAGISFGAKILPVRVLGKCGGYDSDIIAGVRWAAGLPVPGVPDNPNPARVINLSLGSSGGCTAAFAEAVTELAARGALIVAPAGNETGPVESPANCPGVLAVAGVRHIGTKVGYSSFGPEVAISAPAGNCVNPAPGPCAFSIRTTTNLGTQEPGPSGYTDEFAFNIGTSFSAPQAAGVAALMLSVNPGLAPADIIARIKQSARAFPFDAGVPTCPAVATGADTSGQCNCTAATCGAGILDAAAAVAAASPPAVQLAAGWNLIGNGTEGAVDVAAAFGDPSKVATVWKWLSGAAAWAFYSPALADGGAAFAAANGHASLTSVASGEGFWVNAKEPFGVFIGSGNLRATASFRDGTGPGGGNPLPAGWSLIAVGDNPSPRAFANGIAAAPPAAETQAAASLTTLWAWRADDGVLQPGWFFYAPALDNSGELPGYIGAKGYLDFGALGKDLDATTGFWVNRP